LTLPAYAIETVVVTGQRIQGVRVATLEKPQQLNCLDVVNTDGARIGTVSSVKIGSDGKANRVMVVFSTADASARVTTNAPVGQARVAALRPDKLILETEDKSLLITQQVMADYSAAQLTQLTKAASYLPARGFTCQSGNDGGWSKWR
jgi:hypothetical protein